MELTSEQKQTVQNKFDSYCKKSMRGEARHYFRELQRKRAKEILFSEMTEKQLDQLYGVDRYCSDNIFLKVMDKEVEIESEQIFKAILKLTEKQRAVILMAYFLDMTETEIGECMNLVQSTIHYHKRKSLRLLKRILENNNEQNKKNAHIRNNSGSSKRKPAFY